MPATDSPPDQQEGRASSLALVNASPWLVSFLVHGVALVLLGLITYAARSGGEPLQLLAYSGDTESALPGLNQQPWVVEPDWREGTTPDNATPDVAAVEVPAEAPKIAASNQSSAATRKPRPAAGKESARTGDAPSLSNAPRGGGLAGRGHDARSALAGQRGGSRQSELAVEQGLRWLAAHQRNDGSWCFDLTRPPCNGLCRNSGKETSTTAATALALLPFLGAGYTHNDGEHQDAVKRGLYYLGTRARLTPHGVDLQDSPPPGAMYGQAMATITLCEAYAMTKDAALRDLAQEAIRFIVFAQDVQGGGWRYTPGAPGDTTVTGWQLMALKSGQLAKLNVPSPTVGLVERFLDSVQTDGGARYNYLATASPRQTNTTTAVGLLCRMYLGWHRDKPALYRGVEYLSKWGPSENNMYYNYYATQVLHHWEGPEWQAWNGRMRDYLIATQSKNSHEAGSWHFPDPYGDVGGRLYNTALAVLTLEVYYRYLPLYGADAILNRF